MRSWAFQHFDRRWRFDLTPVEFWSVICRTEEYPLWWEAWLPRFSSTGGLEPGSVLDARIQWRRIPFGLDVRIAVEECEPARHLEVTIGGDVAGESTVDIEEQPDRRCSVHVDTSMEVVRPGYRRLLVMAGPVVDLGFEWGLAVGEAAFRRRVETLGR